MKDRYDMIIAIILGMGFIGAILISLFHLSPTLAGIIGAFIGYLLFKVKNK